MEELNLNGVPTLFGDAANSEVLNHAHLKHARLLVITVPEDTAAEVIIVGARESAPDLPIIARASTTEGIRRLVQRGAHQVIHPELEGGLQIVRRTLMHLGFSLNKIQGYADVVRRDYYDLSINTEQERQLLQDLLSASENMVISWIRLNPSNPAVERTLAEAKLRAKAGASVVAILRGRELISNPEPQTTLHATDVIGVIGEEEQLQAAEEVFSSSSA